MDEKSREVYAIELATSNAYELEALVRLLEEKGLVTREEVLQKIESLLKESRQKQPKDT